MNRIDRLVGIVLMLQAKKVVRAQDIAERFEISLRTVYRDVRALEEAGLPLSAEAGSGYSLVEGYHVPPVMFTQDEAAALYIGAELVAHLTDESLRKNIESALMKVRSVLPEERKEYLEKIQSTTAVFVRPMPVRDGFVNDVITKLQDALARTLLLEIEYYSGYSGDVTQRIVEPHGLVFYSDYWHLIGYCRLRKDFRDFRTDRIKSVKVHDMKFSGRSFSVKEFFKSRREAENAIEVRVRMKYYSAQLVRERFFFGFIEEHDVDGVRELVFLTPRLSLLARWLLSFGTDVHIVDPPELVVELQRQAQLLADHYRENV